MALGNLSLHPLPSALLPTAAWKRSLSLKLGNHKAHLTCFLLLKDSPSFCPVPNGLHPTVSDMLSGLLVVSDQKVNLVSVTLSGVEKQYQPTHLE